MYKNTLERYLQKYNLNGNVNSVVVNSKNKKLKCRFTTDDKSLLGEVQLSKIDMEEGKLGIYDTNSLQRILNVMNDNVNIKIDSINSKAVRMKIKDSNINANFMLADLSVFYSPPQLKKLPDWDLTYNFDNKFIQTYIKSKSALAEADTFAVKTKNKYGEVIIGWSKASTNNITIPLKEPDFINSFQTLQFNANLLKDIMMSNRESKTGTLHVSEQGLLKIHFEVDDFISTYYLSAIGEND